MIGAGPRGYADWQRVINWDGPSILDHTTELPLGEPVSSGILEASRYGYIGGTISCAGSPMKAHLEWFLDQAGTILLAKRTLWLSPAITNPAQLRVPNLGPWVRVQTDKAPNGTTLTAHLFLTNRTHPCELIPVEPVVCRLLPTIPIAGEVTVNPSDYFSGPAHAWLETGAGSGQFVFYTREGTPPGQAFDFQQLAASSRETRPLVVPFGPMSVVIKNVSGVEANYLVTITASLTGSS